jgi:hypothetical protein
MGGVDGGITIISSASATLPPPMSAAVPAPLLLVTPSLPHRQP